jgi:hypothetical protein
VQEEGFSRSGRRHQDDEGPGQGLAQASQQGGPRYRMGCRLEPLRIQSDFLPPGLPPVSHPVPRVATALWAPGSATGCITLVG